MAPGWKGGCENVPPDHREFMTIDQQRLENALHRYRWSVVAVLSFFYLLVVFVPFLSGLHHDLLSFYFAAQIAFEQGGNPYDGGALQQLGFGYSGKTFPFLYLPPALLFFWPYAFFDFKTVQFLHFGVNNLLIVPLIWLLLRRLLDVPWPSVLFFLLTAVFIFGGPLALMLKEGQVNLFVLLFLLLFWLFLREGWHPAWTGLALGLAVVLKTYPIVFFAFLLAAGHRRALGWCLAMTAALFVLTIPLLPANMWKYWAADVLPYGGYGKHPETLWKPGISANQSINGTASRFFQGYEDQDWPAIIPSQLLAESVPLLVGGALGLWAMYLVWRRRVDSTEPGVLDSGFALFLILSFLVAPFSWIHHALFLLPAIYLLARRYWLGGRQALAFFVLTIHWVYYGSSWGARGLSYLALQAVLLLAAWILLRPGRDWLYWLGIPVILLLCFYRAMQIHELWDPVLEPIGMNALLRSTGTGLILVLFAMVAQELKPAPKKEAA